MLRVKINNFKKKFQDRNFIDKWLLVFLKTDETKNNNFQLFNRRPFLQQLSSFSWKNLNKTKLGYIDRVRLNTSL